MPAVSEKLGFPSGDTMSAHKPHHFSYASATTCPLFAPHLGIPLWPGNAGIIVLACNKWFIRVSYYREQKYPGEKDGSVAKYLSF